MDDHISIGPGDGFTIHADQDGYPAIKIQNAAFVEEPRWLQFLSGDDRYAHIDALINALLALREAKP